jgi:Arc/MetJ family transcription regulator
MLWNSDLMRTTIYIDDDLIRTAAELTGIREETFLVKLGLKALIARASGWQGWGEPKRSSRQYPDAEPIRSEALHRNERLDGKRARS